MVFVFSILPLKKRLLERSPVKLINLTNYLKNFELDSLSIVHDYLLHALIASVTIDHLQTIHALAKVINL